ncbi:MAG: hypothetical protein SCH71_07340 [Desulfobulbaceae bacterium]|nr:hypothetical protein [Desulfobulbaceae bacterium]
MQNLRTDKDVGFLWKSDLLIPVEDNPGWYDQEKFPIITDENGFFNPREAISRKRSQDPVNIVGLGDSFMYGATYEFYEFFKENGLFYYNMSMSRHCPPQYNIILQRDALPIKPDWVIYGIYENDFDETIDFENWQKSHTDWFTFHSGTWFGSAVELPLWRAFLEKYAPGISMLEKRVRRQFGFLGPVSYRKVQTESLTEKEKSEKVYTYIEKAYADASAAGISFLCLLIPVRDVNSEGRSARDYNYDFIYEKLTGNGIPVLDLRPIYNNYPDRKDLFYKMDAHWNRKGMELAEKAILGRVVHE